MRQLTAHKTNGCNDKIIINVRDEPGAGGANHEYEMVIEPNGPNEVGQVCVIHFQNGAIAEAGTNGFTHEALLAILIDRLEGFQRGPFSHPQNENALHNLRAALTQLHKRTAERVERGVEGTTKP